MSAVSFLSQIRKGSSSKSPRVVKAIVDEVQKLRAAGTVIEDEGLIDIGATSKGRLIAEHGKLIYTRKITTLPVHKVPEEPDGTFLVFWLKANHTGLDLNDSSKYNVGIDEFEFETGGGGGGSGNTTIARVNHNKHLCLVDSGGLDLGYLGKKDGVNSVTAWGLNGTDESAQVTNIVDNQRVRVKGTTTGFSITAWVKISDFSQHNTINRRIIAKTDDATNAYALFVTSTNKAVFAVKFNNTEYKVETPATLVTNTWYFIAATFKSSATQEAKIYLNGTVSTTAFAATVTYPNINYLPAANLQLFTNGMVRLIDPLVTDVPPPYDFDTGNFKGMVRDIRIWREKILTQTEITNFNGNKVSITNVGFGGSHIAGFIWVPSHISVTSGFTAGFSSGFNL